MKYPKITALVPQGEHFDESAIVNEGGWVSTTHLTAIEASLGAVPEGYVAQAELDAANAIVTGHESTIAEMNTAATTAQQTIDAKDAEIAKHTATIAALSRRSSGRSGTQPQAGPADEVPGQQGESGKATLSLSDPNHPQNIAARAHNIGQKKEK